MTFLRRIDHWRGKAVGTPTPAPTAHQIDRLWQMLGEPTTPRTATLMQAPLDKKARKIVEEAAELAFDALGDDRDGMIAESADLLCHLTALWRDRGIAPHQVWTEMACRASRLGMAERPPEPTHCRPHGAGGRQPVYRRGDTIGPVTLRQAAEG